MRDDHPTRTGPDPDPVTVTVRISGVPLEAELPPSALSALRGALGAQGPPPSPERPYIPASEAAVLLGRTPDRTGCRRIYGLVADGRLSRHGDGRRLLVSRAEVLALAAGIARPARLAAA